MPDRLTTAQTDHKIYKLVIKPAARVALIILGPIAIAKMLVLTHLVSSRLMDASIGMCLTFGFMMLTTMWLIAFIMPKDELRKVWIYERWLIGLPMAALIICTLIAKYLFYIK